MYLKTTVTAYDVSAKFMYKLKQPEQKASNDLAKSPTKHNILF
jgi:hypothetical protein